MLISKFETQSPLAHETMPTALLGDALGYAEHDPDLRPPQTTLLTVLPPGPVEAGNGRRPGKRAGAREPGDPRPLKRRSQHCLAVWMNEFQWQRYIRWRELVRRVRTRPWRIAVPRSGRPFGRIAFRSSSGDDDGGSSGDAYALLGISPQRRCPK